MIYATNSIRAINSYCADIYEENNIIDSYFYSYNNGYFKPLNEGNVLTTIIEAIKAAFNFIKKKFTELWGKILGLIKTIKEKIHKKKTNTSDNNSNNQDTVKKLSEEDKKKLEEYILKKTQLAKMNKLDLNKVNDKRKILNNISSQMESWNNSLKSIDDFNSKDQYIEYYKTQLYELIDKLFDKKIKIDTDETLEQIYLKIREYLNDNFKIVDTNGEILPEYRKSLLFKLEDLQKYKDELMKQIDEYDKDLQKCAVSISKFIQQSNDRINKLANDCVKNGMNENEAKSVTSEATKNTNGLATIASDISKVAAQNTATLGNIVKKIDDEVNKAMEEFKAKVSSANTIEELKKIFPNTDWDKDKIDNTTFANSLSKEQMIKIIKIANFTIEEFICLREGWMRGNNIMTIKRDKITKEYQGTARKAEDKFAKLNPELQELLFFTAIRSDNLSSYFKEYYDKIIIENSNSSKNSSKKIDDEATVENIKKWFKEGHADYSKLVVYYASLIINKCLDGDYNLYNRYQDLDPSLYRSLFNNRKYVEQLCSNYTSLSGTAEREKKLLDALPKIYPNIKKDSKNIYLKAKKKYIDYIKDEYSDDKDYIERKIEYIKRDEKKFLGFVVEAFDNIYDFDNIHFLNE